MPIPKNGKLAKKFSEKEKYFGFFSKTIQIFSLQKSNLEKYFNTA
jgi:hypothetical protein